MKVSIIIPVYNSEVYLEKCIKSVINQTYKEIEIIIVNDGSTDNSLDILYKYKKIDKRITIIDQENSGGIIARKRGIEESEGEYCLIIDSDDWIETDTVHKLVDYASRYNKPDIIKFRYINEPNGSIQEAFFNNKNEKMLEKIEVFDLLIYSQKFNNIWNSMIKRELFDFDSFIFEKIVHKGEDLQINLQLFLKAKTFLLANDVLYHYYRNSNGITNSMNYKKYIANCLDIFYLHKTKIQMAKKMKIKCDENIIKENFLVGIADLTIKLLQCDNLQKKDFIEIDDVFQKNDIYEFIKDIKIKKINIFKRNICKNIKNRKIKKVFKYRFIYRTYKQIRG